MKTKIILGTVQFGLPYGINGNKSLISKEKVFEILNQARTLGIETLDTAESYGVAESRIGDFHKISNQPFKINTKLKSFGDLETFDRKIDNYLRELSIDRINLLMIHSSPINNLNFFEEYKKIACDRINKFGVSIYNETDLKFVDLDCVDTIQLPFNLIDNYSNKKDLFRILKSKNIEIQARSVFLQGLFFSSINTDNIKLRPLIEEINELRDLFKNRFSLEDLAIAYPLTINEIDGVIFGVDSINQLINNFKSILKTYPISKEDLELIHSFSIKNKSLLDPRNWI